MYYIKAFIDKTTDLDKFTAKDFSIGDAVYVYIEVTEDPSKRRA